MVDNHEVGPESLAVFGHAVSEARADASPLAENLVGEPKETGDDPPRPTGVQGRVVLDLALSGTELGDESRIGGFEAAAEALSEHGQGEEGAVDLDEVQPLGVELGDGHVVRLTSRTGSRGCTARRQPGTGGRSVRRSAGGRWLTLRRSRRESR